jgi:hypothetical protein
LTRYLEREAELGRIRPSDPQIVARLLMGALQKFALQELLGTNDELPIPEQTFTRGLVETLWNGLAPEK